MNIYTISPEKLFIANNPDAGKRKKKKEKMQKRSHHWAICRGRQKARGIFVHFDQRPAAPAEPGQQKMGIGSLPCPRIVP